MQHETYKVITVLLSECFAVTLGPASADETIVISGAFGLTVLSFEFHLVSVVAATVVVDDDGADEFKPRTLFCIHLAAKGTGRLDSPELVMEYKN